MVVGNCTLFKVDLTRHVQLDGNQMQYVKQLPYLGFIMDIEMSLKQLFKTVKKKTSNNLFM